MAPPGELRVNAGVVCLQVKLCDLHLSALEVRFSWRCAIQIYVYLYLIIFLAQISTVQILMYCCHFFYIIRALLYKKDDDKNTGLTKLCKFILNICKFIFKQTNHSCHSTITRTNSCFHLTGLFCPALSQAGPGRPKSSVETAGAWYYTGWMYLLSLNQ